MCFIVELWISQVGRLKNEYCGSTCVCDYLVLSSIVIEFAFVRLDPPSPVIKPVRLKTNENKSKLAETNNIVVDVHCEDGATESESVKIEAPKECPSTVFNYMMRARKDNRIIYAPAKIVVTQLRDPGVDICFHVDMQAYSQIPSLHLRIICPNYEPKQAWINGKECMIHG
uniref:Uncharacterized protein n=1 Tax=Setaria digitata TaxID=48799 RepID=A0A915PNB6_9BILA